MTTTLTAAEQKAEARAKDLLAETAMFDELGLARLAAKARTTAVDLTDALNALQAERSARQAIQAERDRLRALLAAK